LISSDRVSDAFWVEIPINVWNAAIGSITNLAARLFAEATGGQSWLSLRSMHRAGAIRSHEIGPLVLKSPSRIAH